MNSRFQAYVPIYNGIKVYILVKHIPNTLRWANDISTICHELALVGDATLDSACKERKRTA
jgi:hypothetical protein